jgi:uncharacterized protein
MRPSGDRKWVHFVKLGRAAGKSFVSMIYIKGDGCTMPQNGFVSYLAAAPTDWLPISRASTGRTARRCYNKILPDILVSVMFLSIKEMELRKVRFDETFQPGQIDFSDEDLTQSAPLRVTGSAELLAHSGGEIRVQGEYKGELTAECDRCLAQTRFPLDSGFDLFYRPMSDIAHDEEVEIDEGETELGFYEGAGMQLEDILREQVLLALPMQRVCREDCKGICPVCGKNRNETACACKVVTADDRWGALRNLEP